MQEFAIRLLHAYPIASPIVLIIMRALAIIIPPIPGAIVDVAAIATFGKIIGFLYAEIGIMVGASVSFLLARKFREGLVKRFVSLQKLHAWEDTLSERRKFWALVIFRIPTTSLFDYLSYVAGLTKMGFGTFFFSSFLGQLLPVGLFFLIGDIFIRRGTVMTIVFVASALLIPALFGKDRVLRKITSWLAPPKP